MINSINVKKTSLVEDFEIKVNENYLGFGALSFMEECAQDEMSIFEAGIISDIKETKITESTELKALNEGFVQNAYKQIKEMMERLMEFITGVMRSAFAKLESLIIVDNVKFGNVAKKKINAMKTEEFKYEGKAITDKGALKLSKANDLVAEIGKFTDSTMAKKESIETIKDHIEKFNKDIEGLSVSETLKTAVSEVNVKGDAAETLVVNHLKMLTEYNKADVKLSRESFAASLKTAKKIHKTVKKLAGAAKEEEKELANAKVQLAALYKKAVAKASGFYMGLLKAETKIARHVVTKALALKTTNESVMLITSEGFIEATDELVNATLESFEYELDEALIDMSEAEEFPGELDATGDIEDGDGEHLEESKECDKEDSEEKEEE